MDGNISETASTILHWLGKHPADPSSYAAFTVSQLTSKQREQNSQFKTHRGNKRGPLEEIVNGMPEKKRKRALETKNAETAAAAEFETPFRTGRRDLGISIAEDADVTPRSLFNQSEPPVLGSHIEFGLSRGDSSPTRSTTSSSRSPVRRLGDLQLTGNPVRAVDIDSERYPLSTQARSLVDDIRKLASGRCVIPDSVKIRAKPLIIEGRLQESNFGADRNSLIPAQPPRARNDEQVWERIGEILYEAKWLKEDFASEPAWNTEVHSRILNLVLYGWREDSQLWYFDATTARIHGAPVVSKMVDYTICLTPDIDTEDMIITKLRSQNMQSINHTRAEYIRFKPIAISIETKRPGMDEDTGEVQLGVWAAAHFQKLVQLSNKTDMPVLPQIFIQGHDWRLKIAVQHQGTVIIYGDIPIGDTRDHLGVYKIIASLRYLCHWATTEYRTWFIDYCLSI